METTRNKHLGMRLMLNVRCNQENSGYSHNKNLFLFALHFIYKLNVLNIRIYFTGINMHNSK